MNSAMSHRPFEIPLCQRSAIFSKQQSPTVCNSCYSFTDLERMEAWVWAVCPVSWTSDLLHGQARMNMHARCERVCALTNWPSQTDPAKYAKTLCVLYPRSSNVIYSMLNLILEIHGERSQHAESHEKQEQYWYGTRRIDWEERIGLHRGRYRGIWMHVRSTVHNNNNNDILAALHIVI